MTFFTGISQQCILSGLFLMILSDISYISALSDVNVTKFGGISQEDLQALPPVQCKPVKIYSSHPIQSCIFENQPREVFMVGYNKTLCYLCRLTSTFAKIDISQIHGIKWYARLGKYHVFNSFYCVFQNKYLKLSPEYLKSHKIFEIPPTSIRSYSIL